MNMHILIKNRSMGRHSDWSPPPYLRCAAFARFLPAALAPPGAEALPETSTIFMPPATPKAIENIERSL